MALCVATAPMNESCARANQLAKEMRPPDSGELKLAHVQAKKPKNSAVHANWRKSSLCRSKGFFKGTELSSHFCSREASSAVEDLAVMLADRWPKFG